MDGCPMALLSRLAWGKTGREKATDFIAEVPKTSLGKFDKKVLRERFKGSRAGRVRPNMPARPERALRMRPPRCRCLLRVHEQNERAGPPPSTPSWIHADGSAWSSPRGARCSRGGGTPESSTARHGSRRPRSEGLSSTHHSPPSRPSRAPSCLRRHRAVFAHPLLRGGGT